MSHRSEGLLLSSFDTNNIDQFRTQWKEAFAAVILGLGETVMWQWEHKSLRMCDRNSKMNSDFEGM